MNECLWNLLVSESNTYSSGQRRKPISTGKIRKLMAFSSKIRFYYQSFYILILQSLHQVELQAATLNEPRLPNKGVEVNIDQNPVFSSKIYTK